MVNLTKKIIFKIVILLLIIVVPIATYIFIEDDAQLTWNINGIRDMNKYIITAEFIPEKEQLYVTENIEYINKTNKSIDRVFVYIKDILNSNENLCYDLIDELSIKDGEKPHKNEEIESVKIKNKKVNFKLIGKDNDVLMINLDKKLEKNDRVTIEINYKTIVSHLASVTNGGSKKYMLNSWYPVVAKYDNGWKLESIYNDNNLNKDMNYFFVEIIVPDEFEVEASGRLVEKMKKKNNYHFRFQDQGALSFKVNLTSTK